MNTYIAIKPMKLRHGDDPDYWLAVAKCFLLNNGSRSAKKACEKALYCRKNFPEARFVVADANEGADEEAAEREYAALLEIKELSPFLVSKISLKLANIKFRQSTRAMNENAFGTKEEKQAKHAAMKKRCMDLLARADSAAPDSAYAALARKKLSEAGAAGPEGDRPGATPPGR